MHKQSMLILLIVTIGVICASLGATADGPAPWRSFDLAGKTVSIQPDVDSKGLRSYEILVEENGLAVARLSVNRNGVLSNAWKTDLDADGNPEIVVAVVQLAGTNEGSADIHEWDGYKFLSERTSQKISGEKSRYAGHDQYDLRDGILTREFPRFNLQNGAQVPSSEKARYRFDMQAGRWIAQ